MKDFNLVRRIFLIALFIFSGLLSVFPQTNSNFILWQLPSQINTIGNSYVFQMENGKVVVMDGGVKEECEYLRGFLAALGNEVEAWFISHPHGDHMGALNQILIDPGEIRIKTIYHSELPPAFYKPNETESSAYSTEGFYNNLSNSGIQVLNINEPGMTVEIDQTKFKILSVANPNITVNAYNNSSMAIKVWDTKKSILFLGDMGAEGGDRLLAGPYGEELDCDYLQMAHHGQQGVRKDFYRSIEFRVCLWPTPSWVYQNDQGEGYNTGNLQTIEIRELMDSMGIKEHYLSFEGLTKID